MSASQATMMQMIASQKNARRASLGRTPMGLDQLAYYNPNRPDATEAIWQPTYDYQSYGTAGATSQIFFQVPNGQSGKTFFDTNMVLPGQFAAPTAFLCVAVMVYFDAGAAESQSTTNVPLQTNINDVVSVANSGWLELTIGSKVYLRDAPIGKFPPNFTINGFTAISANFTAPVVTHTGFARAAGRYYEVTPFLVPQGQNFNVTIQWPSAVTVVTTGRIGVILDGFLYRQSQ